jgi:hypothetical protein
MNRKLITLAIVALAALTMGNTACDPDSVEPGQELATINQAWKYEPTSELEQIQRLELVVQLQERRYAQTRADLMMVINCLDGQSWNASPCADWHLYPTVAP